MAEQGREVLEGFHSHSLAAGDLLHLISWTFDQRLKFSMLLEVKNVYQVCISIFDQVLPHLLQRSNGAQPRFSIHCYSEYFWLAFFGECNDCFMWKLWLMISPLLIKTLQECVVSLVG